MAKTGTVKTEQPRKRAVKNVKGFVRHRELEKKTPTQRIGPNDFRRIALRAGVVRCSNVLIREHELVDLKEDIQAILRIASSLADADRKKGITPTMMKRAFLKHKGLTIFG